MHRKCGHAWTVSRTPSPEQAMDLDRLNVSSPFEDAPPKHENQLTGALLVTLRMSPIAHGD
jgi:hypothetical protein